MGLPNHIKGEVLPPFLGPKKKTIVALLVVNQGVTKRCRLPSVTNSALVYEPKSGEGGVAGSQPISTAVHRSPNKLWRSNSIFNLQYILNPLCINLFSSFQDLLPLVFKPNINFELLVTSWLPRLISKGTQSVPTGEEGASFSGWGGGGGLETFGIKMKNISVQNLEL
jgi:hypothetical protein